MGVENGTKKDCRHGRLDVRALVIPKIHPSFSSILFRFHSTKTCVCFLFLTFRTMFLFPTTRTFESTRRQEPFLYSGHGGTGHHPLSSSRWLLVDGLGLLHQCRFSLRVSSLSRCRQQSLLPRGQWRRMHTGCTRHGGLALAKVVAYGDKAPPGDAAHYPCFPQPTSPAT
jgi:hypothetical protein